MKKQIARMVTAVLVIAAFAGILSACTSKNAVEMQGMIDQVIKDFETPTSKAFQTAKQDEIDARIEAIEKFYEDLEPADRKAAGMNKAKKNLEKLADQITDYRLVNFLVMQVDSMIITINMPLQLAGTYDPNAPVILPEAYYGTALYLLEDYNSLTKAQRDLYSGCDQAHADELTAVYAQLLEWQAQVDEAWGTGV